jgi:hypothetical protein
MIDPAKPQTPYRFRRSQSLLALTCFISATGLAFADFVSGNGLFWKLVQLALLGAGGFVFWRENRRARIAMISANLPAAAELKPRSD